MNEELKYAGFWIRSLAAIIDFIIVSAITIPLLWLVYGKKFWGNGAEFWESYPNKEFWDISTFTLMPTEFLLEWIFPVVFTLLFWNYYLATPGKLLLKAKIVDATTGKKPTLGKYIVRYIGYIPSFFVFGLGIFWVAFDTRKQGWHDKMANTVVIRKKQSSKVQFETTDHKEKEAP